MALQGNLRDFGISDVFQLIQQQQKAGVLTLKSPDSEVRVYFLGGKIVGVDALGPKREKDPLGTLLLRAGLVRKDQLDAALAAQQKNLRKLGDLLIADRAISKESLKSFLDLQMREALNRLFRWRSGAFEFVPQPVEFDEEMTTPLNPEHVLMDGFRMVDEWPGVLKAIHSLDAIPVVPRGMADQVSRKERGSGAPEGDEEEEDDGLDAAFSAFDEGVGAGSAAIKIKLSSSETVVFDLIDGKRTVQEICHRSLLGEFNTCHALASLLEKKVAGISGRARGEGLRLGEWMRPRRELTEVVVGVSLTLAVLLLAATSRVVFKLGERGPETSRSLVPSRAGTLFDAVDQHRVRHARRASEIFFLRTGRWPKGLEELLEADLVAEDDLETMDGRPLRVAPPESAGAAPRIFR